VNFLNGDSLSLKLPSFLRNFPSFQTTSHSNSISTITTIILPSKLFRCQVIKLSLSLLEQILPSYISRLCSSPTPYPTSSYNTGFLHHAYRDRQEEENFAHDTGTSGVRPIPPGVIEAHPPG